MQGYCSCWQLQFGSCERIQKCCRVTSVKCMWTAFYTLNKGEDEKREKRWYVEFSLLWFCMFFMTEHSAQLFSLWNVLLTLLPSVLQKGDKNRSNFAYFLITHSTEGLSMLDCWFQKEIKWDFTWDKVRNKLLNSEHDLIKKHLKLIGEVLISIKHFPCFIWLSVWPNSLNTGRGRASYIILT